MFYLFSWNLKVKNGFLTASSCWFVWFVVKIHSCVCREYELTNNIEEFNHGGGIKNEE